MKSRPKRFFWEARSSISARNQPLPEYQVAAQGSLVFTLRLEVSIVRKCVKQHPTGKEPIFAKVSNCCARQPGFHTTSGGKSYEETNRNASKSKMQSTQLHERVLNQAPQAAWCLQHV